MDIKRLKQIAYARRLEVLDMVHRSRSGHIGGDMSCMDALVTLYYDVMDVPAMLEKAPDAPHFILSKGHCAEALYTVLADCSFFPKEELTRFAAFGTKLAEHPVHGLPGVDIATGSLGHGLSIGCGLALGNQKQGMDGRIYVMMGDGEQAEGSIWEAVMFAAKYKLDRLIAVIDRNHLQISGSTEEVMPLGELQNRYEAFGWNTVVCDGHDFAQLQSALRAYQSGKPTAVILNTIKGKGSPLMENQADWHHHIPDDRQYEIIRADLERAAKEA